MLNFKFMHPYGAWFPYMPINWRCGMGLELLGLARSAAPVLAELALRDSKPVLAQLKATGALTFRHALKFSALKFSDDRYADRLSCLFNVLGAGLSRLLVGTS